MIIFLFRGEDIPDSICEGDGGGPLVCPGNDDFNSILSESFHGIR